MGRKLVTLKPWGTWAVAAIPVALVAAPLAAIALSFQQIDPSLWQHLWRYNLASYLSNTLALVLVVGAAALFLGSSLAWLVTAYRFPGARFFSWALVMPLALPGYVLAFVFASWLDFAGPVASTWRSVFGQPLPLEIRSFYGAAGVLTLALFPYVFLTARAAFMGLGQRALEVGQTLGFSPAQAFWRVVLPLARPWLAAGTALVMMETLADFGVVALLGVDTFTTGIYKAWYGWFSLPTALQLASLLVLLAFVALWLEQSSRRRARFGTLSMLRSPELQPQALCGVAGWFAFAACAAVFALAFALPIWQLASWTWQYARDLLSARYWEFAWHSLLLGLSGAAVTAVMALALTYAQRLNPSPAMAAAARFATLGYALPGAVLAVGILYLITTLDRAAIAWGLTSAPFLGGTMVAMLMAYATRFLAVAHGPIAAAAQRLTPTLDEAAITLGASATRRLRQLHWPLLRAGLITAAAFTSIDIMKELPITLMTRPFGWDTLATRIFELTSDGRWHEAALPALTLALVGIIPVLILVRAKENRDVVL